MLICPYCHSSLSRSADGQASDMMRTCVTCGAWYRNVMPSAQQLEQFYTEETSQGIDHHLRYWREGTSQSQWYRFLAQRIQWWLRHWAVDLSSNLRIADIGAGDLELSVELASQFSQSEVAAFDLHLLEKSRLPHVFASRISTYHLDLNRLESMAKMPVDFDIVACISVIEHVIEPYKLLDLLCRITKPGGLIYVVGPNIDSWARKLLKTRWPYYEPDQHLTLPSPHSLQMAVRGSCPHSQIMIKPIAVRYSLTYLLRYAGLIVTLPPTLDRVVAVPSGAFEMAYLKSPHSDQIN